MTGAKVSGSHLSPFDLGQKAGGDPATAEAANPFPAGTAAHNNFEIGRRFGISKAATDQRDRLSPDDMRPDPDEDDDCL